jgi:hypothetical protein
MKKTAFAIGTAVPLIYGIALLLIDFGTSSDRFLSKLYVAVVVVVAITWVAYIVDVVRNDALDKSKRGLWLALLIFGSIFAEVAYFVTHILRDMTMNNASRHPERQDQ